MDRIELLRRQALIPERFRGGAAADLVDPNEPPRNSLEEAKRHLEKLQQERLEKETEASRNVASE